MTVMDWGGGVVEGPRHEVEPLTFQEFTGSMLHEQTLCWDDLRKAAVRLEREREVKVY